MDFIIYEIPAFDGNPNGKIVAPIGSLFYKNGIVYRINYSGFQSSNWPRVYFQNKRTPTEVESLGIVDTGIYLYLKETNPNSSSGWKLFSRKDIFMSYVTPVTPTPTPTPTSTPTETPTPTSTPTSTPTETPTPTPTSTPTSTPTETPTETPTLAGWVGTPPASGTNPHGANLTLSYTPVTNGYSIDYNWTPMGPWVYWEFILGTGPGLYDLADISGTQTIPYSGSFTVTNGGGDIWITGIIQNEYNGGSVTASPATLLYPPNRTPTPTPTPTATPTPTPIMPPMDAFSSYPTGSITLADGGQGWLHDGVFGVVDYYTIAVIDAFSSYPTGSITLADGGQNWTTTGSFAVNDYYTIAVIDAFSSYQTGSIILADGGQNWATNGTFTTT